MATWETIVSSECFRALPYHGMKNSTIILCISAFSHNRCKPTWPAHDKWRFYVRVQKHKVSIAVREKLSCMFFLHNFTPLSELIFLPCIPFPRNQNTVTSNHGNTADPGCHRRVWQQLQQFRPDHCTDSRHCWRSGVPSYYCTTHCEPQGHPYSESTQERQGKPASWQPTPTSGSPSDPAESRRSGSKTTS